MQDLEVTRWDVLDFWERSFHPQSAAEAILTKYLFENGFVD